MEVCFDRQFEFKTGSAIRITCRPEMAAVVLYDRAHNRKAHAHALWFGREESIKQPRHDFRIYAFPGVADQYTYASSFGLTCTNLYLPASPVSQTESTPFETRFITASMSCVLLPITGGS